MSGGVGQGGEPLGSRLELLGGPMASCRLAPDAEIPEWARADPPLPVAVLRSENELSIVCSEGLVPDGVTRSGGWSCMRVAGRLEHSQVGILSALAAPLAESAIPIFAISSFDTDYLMVPEHSLPRARQALEWAGHVFSP